MIKLFSHRGFVTKRSPENSIKSLESAFLKGFSAIEFDIWFSEKKLILSHDSPNQITLKMAPQLKDYFKFGNQLNYWLDFKNLDEKNIAEALIETQKVIDEKKIDLSKIYFAPFITDYQKSEKIMLKIRKIFGEEVNFVAVCENLKDRDEINKLGTFLRKNKIKFLSINHELIDKTLIKILSEIELFAWTVNDIKIIKNLANIGVKNFATDKITPHIYEKRLKSKK